MGFLFQFLTNIVILATQPISLIKLVCQLVARTVLLVSLTWLQLVKNAINVLIEACWNVMIWTFAIISLPSRILCSLRRERLLELHLNEMLIQLETLVWEKKELDERLQVAVKDHKLVEAILTEIEDEHDKALSRIEFLENEVQGLKDENLRLKEFQANIAMKFKVRQGDICGKNGHGDYGVSSWSSGFNKSDMSLQDLLMQGVAWEDENTIKSQYAGFLNNDSKAIRRYPISSRVIPRNLVLDEALDRRRGAALSQSVFSAILSLLVGMIVWEAQDPCMPLVVALYTVVGMSLWSVVQFFSTLENRPASDAVALLSFNWFILGTLTAPTLPSVARLLAPLFFRLADKVVCCFGFASLQSGELVSP